MNCNHIYISGKNKGNVCNKENCKRHLKKNGKDEKPIEEENKLYKYALEIKKDIEDLYENKKETKVFYIKENEYKNEVIVEKINPGYETQIYIMTRFMSLKKEPLSDFKRIIFPLKEYKELDAELYCMGDMQFLFKFADVKTQL